MFCVRGTHTTERMGVLCVRTHRTTLAGMHFTCMHPACVLKFARMRGARVVVRALCKQSTHKRECGPLVHEGAQGNRGQ